MSTSLSPSDPPACSRRSGLAGALRRLVRVPPTVSGRPEARRLSAASAYGMLAVAYVLAFGYSVYGQAVVVLSGAELEMAPPSAGELWPVALASWAQGGALVLLALLAVLLCSRAAGVRVREVFAPEASGRVRGQWWRAFAVALVAYTVCAQASSLLRTATGSPGGFSMESGAEAVRMVVMLGPAQVTTGFVEETVAVGCLVVLLGAARRPAWEVGAVAVVAKLAYHAYFGWPVLALAPAALVMVWLYARTGRLWPLIAAHAAYNLLNSVYVLALAALAPSAL
ncbi:CPBP family intramembrane glutamic endopeptidase [Nocardiopsis baichengensis]|uniref:CPBP family intramembrane glutamic endopeptidase n=1 Tax=Nocardiopsis baichengensis TaxID=280240 RepID=UPI001EF9CB0C|nr:CPBP family intramembrane glutamic endopeptidase [Nocardiopsis baichengensis]